MIQKAMKRVATLLLPITTIIFAMLSCTNDDGYAEGADNLHLNFTEHAYCDDPVIDNLDANVFDSLFNAEYPMRDSILGLLMEDPTMENALRLESQIKEMDRPFKNEFLGMFYFFASTVTTADEGDKVKNKRLWYNKLIEVYSNDTPTAQAFFMFSWKICINNLIDAGDEDFASREILRMLSYFQRNNIQTCIIGANYLLADILLKQHHYNECYMHLEAADSAAKQYLDDHFKSNWITDSSYNDLKMQYFDSRQKSVLCKLEVQDTAWYHQHIDEMKQFATICPDNQVKLMLIDELAMYSVVMYDEDNFFEMMEWHDAATQKEDTTLTLGMKVVNADDRRHECMAYFEAKHSNYQKALDHLAQIKHPENSRHYHRIKAECNMQLGRYEEAAWAFRGFYRDWRKALHNSRFALLKTLTQQIEMEDKEMELMRSRMQSQKIRGRFTLSLSVALLVIVCIITYFLRKQHKLNTHLSKALKEAKKADQAKTQFLRSITHEMNTPLNAIQGFVQMLQPNSEDEQFMVGEIRNNSDKLKSLIDSTIALSDYESESNTLEAHPTSVLMACTTAIESCSAMCKENVTLGMAYDKKDIEVSLNGQALVQMLHCLIENALKFTQEGSVTVDYHMAGNQLVIEVTDSGIGIPMSERERVFERFVKLDNCIPGFGLGLPLARTIAQRMGGEMSFDADYQQGIKVKVQIPVTLQNMTD